jgi:hypothetical protein
LESIDRPQQSVTGRREERELFFWTVRQILKTALSCAFTIYVIVTLIEGDLPGMGLLHVVLGTG